MGWVTMLILLNGLSCCSLGYITVNGKNRTTSERDEHGCINTFLNLCKLCEKQIKNGSLETIVNVTVCYTRPINKGDVTVEDILANISENTRYLKVVLDNTWQGILPFQAGSINLSSIKRLKQLVYFNLYLHSDKYIQLYPLNFTKETFSGMKNLRVVILNIPIKDQSLQDLLSPLENLQKLFLQPRAISMENMSDTIANLHPNAEYTLKILHLSNFQLLGMNGYNSTLNITDFLSNRTFRHVKQLYLRGNSLAKLLPGIPVHFPNIEHIDISYNLLIDMTNIYSFSELVVHNNLVTINYQHQGYVGGSHLTTDSNYPRPYDTYKETFKDSANGNFIIQCMNRHDNINGTANISKFFQNNTTKKKVLECIAGIPLDYWIDYLNPVEHYFDANCILFLKIPIGPHVNRIQYSYVHLEETTFKGLKYSGNLCIKEPNNLTVIDISRNRGWMPMSKLADTLNSLTAINGLKHVEIIILSNNFLEINASIVFKNENFPNLKRLYLGNNSVLIDANYGFCTHNKLLTHLNLEGNRLGPKANLNQFVANCKSLKYLRLQLNNLSQHDLLQLNLTGTENLKLLDLSRNSIEYLPDLFRNQIDQKVKLSSQNLTIDLTGNNLICDCRAETINFLKWMIGKKTLVKFKNLNNITCTGKFGIRGIDRINERIIEEWKFQCHKFYILVYIIPSAIFSILLTICSFYCYNKRYVIGYKMFKLKQALARICSHNSKEEETNWLYDVFISYCADDRFWVHSLLMKTLEEEYGFKLCIHYRDFPVGELIIDSIVDKMNQSQYLIVVISDVSLKSEWCQFELIQAMHQVNQFHKTLIAIQLGELKDVHEHRTASHILQTHVALHWNDKNSKASAFFWKKLVNCLYGDTEGQYRLCWGSCKKSIAYNEIYDIHDD